MALIVNSSSLSTFTSIICCIVKSCEARAVALGTNDGEGKASVGAGAAAGQRVLGACEEARGDESFLTGGNDNMLLKLRTEQKAGEKFDK